MTTINDRTPMDMKDIQKVSLNILKFVTSICHREGLRYSLMYGTLIGAIRHKGYIPWDDDVDIMMPRPDYDRFLKYCYCHKDELGAYELYNMSTHQEYVYGISRVCDSRYVIYSESTNNINMGIFIDIYPYDGLGNNIEKAIKTMSKARKYCDIIVDISNKNWTIPKMLNYKGKIVYIWNMITNRLLGVKYFHKKILKLRADFTYDTSEYVGPLMWYFTKPYKVVFKRSYFDNLILAPFEDSHFFIPSEYDALLTQEYGDYMTLPPIEQRIYHHHYTAYKK